MYQAPELLSAQADTNTAGALSQETVPARDCLQESSALASAQTSSTSACICPQEETVLASAQETHETSTIDKNVSLDAQDVMEVDERRTGQVSSEAGAGNLESDDWAMIERKSLLPINHDTRLTEWLRPF